MRVRTAIEVAAILAFGFAAWIGHGGWDHAAAEEIRVAVAWAATGGALCVLASLIREDR